jgi:hypothetical protein
MTIEPARPIAAFLDPAYREDDEVRSREGMRLAAGTPSVPARAAADDLAGKLHLTRIALGCSTHKELAARFAQVNRSTAFTTQSAYKWLRGKATPRTSSIYQDWSRLLDGKLAPPFVAAASFEEFAQALCRHFTVPDAAMAKLRGAPSLRVRTPVPDTWRDSEPARRIGAIGTELVRVGPGRRASLLAGVFLAVTPAWSRRQAGQLTLSAIRISEAPDGALAMEHCERVLGHMVASRGTLGGEGRTVHGALHCQHTGRVQFLSLHVPTFPAHVIVGLMCGTALYDADTRSVGSRILLLRSLAPGWEALTPRTGTLEPDAAGLSRELAALGYGAGRHGVDEASETLLRFFAARTDSGAIEVAGADFRALSDAMAGLVD